jgi:hypothetical protein
VTKNETQVDLTVEIPEAPAEWPAEQSESQCSATLQYAAPTKKGQTLAEPGPITEPVFENSDDELKHLFRIVERIQKQREIKELHRLIAGKTIHARGESLNALTEPLPPKRVVTKFATLPIQRATVYPSPNSGGRQKELDEFIQRVVGVLAFDADIYRTPSNRTRFA